ncbi:TonB-dependent receptor domain-containing protein [Bacterioplanoides sp.]|uniref:TonB-dependent receptor n=1 Tax=Bacterioplanoides sp. TaxID=2066072 RepID=UPI003B5B0CA2
MKRNRLLLAMASAMMASSVMAGEAVFYVTEDGEAVQDLAVSVDGKKKLVGKSGFVSFDVPAGSHTVELSQYGEFLGEFDFETAAADQNAEIQVEMIGGEALPEVNLYTPGQEQAAALGQISGYLESEDTGGAISGARISIAGTEQAVVTDEDGFFSFELARGEYDLVISDPNYGKRDVSGVRVMSNVNTGVNLNLSLEGEGVIEEVVAVGSYIPSTATAQERDSAAVLDSIGSEQMSRFGDSNAAAALKRVVGVSISDGKYVVVRGLNERHSAIMLNGASLPSPDPSRRVVPLDIFPSTILDGINVQKNFTPNVFADSTGGVVKLTTKKFPEEFEGKVSASIGYVDGLTFKSRDVQQSQSLDILGFGSGDDRELPGAVSSIEERLASDDATSAEERAATDSLASNLGTEEKTILPNTSLEISLGDTLSDTDEMTLGYTASLKYSNSWSREDRKTNSYIVDDGKLKSDDEFMEKRTKNNINLGAGLSVGAIFGENELTSNTMVLRQTQADSRIRRGVGGDQDRESIYTKLGWYERQFLFQQFTGEHFLTDFLETEIDWQISFSEAKLDAPDEREYSFERTPDANEEFELYWSSADRTYNELTDQNTDFGVDLSSLVYASDELEGRLKYGFSSFSRERDSDGTRLTYRGNGQTASNYAGNLDIDEIIDDSTAKGIARITSNSSPSDDYKAEWDLTSYYLMSEVKWFDRLNVLFGARAEDSEMTVNTFTLGSTIRNPEAVQAKVEDDDVFPSISTTFHVMEELQLRAAYYETKNRPDFRELANAQYIDPDTGDSFRGNPNLVSAEVKNTDVRAEWYFSDSESVSLAYFTKDFDNPIEKTLLTGGDVFSFENGDSGNVSGWELDFRKEYELENYSTFVGGNFSVIDSEVEIVVDTVNKKQSMQGQPDQLANLQLGLDDFDLGAEYTLVINYQGESLDSVAPGVLPNVMREPRTEINLNAKIEVGENTSIKAKVKNITDDEVKLTQGGKNFRSYKKGAEVQIGFTMEF